MPVGHLLEFRVAGRQAVAASLPGQSTVQPHGPPWSRYENLLDALRLPYSSIKQPEPATGWSFADLQNAALPVKKDGSLRQYPGR